MTVVGDVDVGPSIVVEVGAHDAERRPERPAHQSFGRDIRECAITIVVIQPVPLRPIDARRAVVPPAVHVRAFLIGLDVVLRVVAHVQIEPSIAVVVHERGRHSPAGIIRPALLRDVGKRSVAVVAEQLVPSEIGEVEIDAAVVVEVAGRHPHAIPTGVDPALLGHIREMQRARPVGVDLQVISEKPTPERERTLRR